MASKLKRTIYTHSGVRVIPVDPTFAGSNAAGAWVSGPHAQPKTVQNATMTLNIPRADVNVFGVIGVVDRPQLEAETATIEFAFIPEKIGSQQLVAANSSLLPADIDALILDAIAQSPAYVGVHADGVGHIKQALMNSFSGEATIGGLPTMTMSFTGATNDYGNLDGSTTDETHALLAPPAQPTHAGCFAAVAGGGACPVDATAFDVDLVEPQDINLAHRGNLALDAAQTGAGAVVNDNLTNEPVVTLGDDGAVGGAGDDADVADVDSAVNPDDDTNSQTGCAQSASFSWDLPVETILCLGANPKADGVSLGNPPGTSSFTVEALSLQLEQNINAQNYRLIIGTYTLDMANGSIDSRTHNLAVGDLYGSYNYVIGGTADGFRSN
ncbi:hypothetical protein CMI37_16685 [Candidatus Pacearchaeota archaeon]|nr:hypothetical protein [Candidatus Pacearchaeota archaeon]